MNLHGCRGSRNEVNVLVFCIMFSLRRRNYPCQTMDPIQAGDTADDIATAYLFQFLFCFPHSSTLASAAGASRPRLTPAHQWHVQESRSICRFVIRQTEHVRYTPGHVIHDSQVKGRRSSLIKVIVNEYDSDAQCPKRTLSLSQQLCQSTFCVIDNFSKLKQLHEFATKGNIICQLSWLDFFSLLVTCAGQW